MEMVVGLRVLRQLTTIRSRANMTRHPGGRGERRWRRAAMSTLHEVEVTKLPSQIVPPVCYPSILASGI
jgi:hypothetical protein